jgi:two-component system sensor histidine kinase DesK
MSAFPEEIRFLYIAFSFVLILFLGFIYCFVILFNKRQNELLLKSQLEEQQFRNNLLSKEIENQQNLIKERERISEDIHDDIGGILSAIRLEAEFVKKKTKSLPDIRSSLDSISENTLVASNNFREMIWCLHSRNDNVSELIHHLTSYGHALFEKANIHLTIEKAIILEEYEISGFKRRQLLLAYKEILNNIIKHSEAKTAQVRFLLSNQNLLIHIIWKSEFKTSKVNSI